MKHKNHLTGNNLEKNEHKAREVKISTIIYSILILASVIISVIGAFIYGVGIKNDTVKKIEKIIPYPAVSINGLHFITISNLNDNLESVRKFYENQDFSKVNLRVDFSTESGQKRLKIKEKEILNRMVEDKAVEIIARKKGIKVSNATVDQNLSRKIEEYGGENLTQNLQNLYGWTVQDFKDEVVKPDIYRQELENLFDSENPSVQEAKDQIENAQAELDKKTDFGEVAKAYSKGSTANDGGELGWFKKDQLIPDISDKVFSLEKGERSDILESQLGFHIVEVEDKKTENGEDLVRIRQIFSPKKLFSEFLTEEMQKMKIFVLLKDYTWNKEDATLEFKSDDMKNFEKDLIENSQGDASVLF
jgi:parvulin-like peptidyl-prolyl isomerase